MPTYEGNHAMNDRMQNESAPAPVSSGISSTKPSRKFLYVGGTVAALVAGGAGLQWWNAQTGSAAEGSGKAAVKQTGTTAEAGTATAQAKREAAAKVTMNGRSISIPLDDVFRECALRVGNDVIESMINRAVIQLACEQQGVQITEAEVEQEIVRISKQFGIPTESWIEMLRQERNITPEQYKRDVIWPMLALKKLAGEKAEVTEKDMQEAFIRHYGARVKCRMIMFDNLRRANEVLAKAELKPDDFPRLAREHSIDPTSRAMEGSVPPIAKYSGNPELEKAAFRLKEGEVSGIIQFGMNRYVILKCEGFTDQKVKDISEVRDALHKDLVEEKVQESVAKLFENMKKGAHINNFWNNTASGDLRQVSGAQPVGGEKTAVRQAAGETTGKTGVYNPVTGTGSKPATSPVPTRPGTSPVKK